MSDTSESVRPYGAHGSGGDAGAEIFVLPRRGTDATPFDIEQIDALDAISAEIGRIVDFSLIDSVEKIKPDIITPTGRIATLGFRLASGYDYAALLCQPNEQVSSIPIGTSSPYTVSVSGHMDRIGRNLMDAGYVAFIAGSEGSYHSKLPRLPKTFISLLLTAGASLSMFTAMAEHTEAEVDEKVITVAGESKAAMTGFGMQLLEKQFGKYIPLLDLFAPGFPRRIEVGDVWRTAKQVVALPWHAYNVARRLHYRRLQYYPSTFDPHPTNIGCQAAMLPALVSGEAGGLATLTANDRLLHVTGFTKDAFFMPTVWEEILAGRPNTRIAPLSGDHITLADPESTAYVNARRRAFDDALATGSDLTMENVFEKAHDYVDQFRH